MGIALSATVRLFPPLSVAMAHWLRPSAPPSIAGYRVALPPASLVPASCDSRGTRQAERLNPHPAHSLRRPLRVVRIVDTVHTAASAGRMTISGSMADVCAELDRRVKAEATRH